MPPVIECAGVSKAFILRTNRQYLLKERALGLLRPHLREARERFWALHDISFAVEAGEMFGLIGANGAGKSTLLRVIAGIFQPTAGAVHVHGRVAALLGLGVGFHQELTGRENIYLGAALFGFTTREIRALESRIIQFAELGQFIDVPVKNYSSGMQVRLGFSIALEVTPDVFLIDEVLAAGDEHFRRKCLRRLMKGRKMGCTYLVASHNLQFIVNRCDRAALIVNGRMAALGPSKEVVRSYEALVIGEDGEQEPYLSSGLP
jgi:ABC-2 type transport system ATP-binding protein/lipopolysaccharide transport system ATP-binding protein